MKVRNGFTLIEVGLVLVAAAAVVGLVVVQRGNFEVMERDERRKTAINAMYYALEEGFFKANQYYPTTISAEILPEVEEKLWTDPTGHKLGEIGSEYVYEAANCEDNKCSEYILRARLEKEDNYIKTNRG